MYEYIGSIPIVAGKSKSLEIFADRLYKSFHFVTKKASFKTTFSAGKPKIHHNGVLGGVIRQLVIQNNGGEDIRTYMGLHQILNDQKIDFTDRGALIHNVNSLRVGNGISDDKYPDLTSGQDNGFCEAFPVFMENRKSHEYYRTYFSTLGNRSAKIIIDFNDADKVLDPEDTSTTSAVEIQGEIEVYGIKADHLIAPYDSFWRHLTSYDQIVPNGATSGTRFTISPEGELQGFWIRAHKGEDDIRFTYEDMENTVIEMKFDGETIVKGNLLALSAINMHDRPIFDVIRGATRIELLNSRTWGTGLFCGEGSNAKQIEVFITCPLTNPKFYFDFDRIRAPKNPEVAKKS